jgi:hypothetical protein
MKAMKTIFTIIMLCGVVGGYAQSTPRYAASTRTWTFGNQTWSDAIRMPECNKTDFTASYTDPHCRSYTEDGTTWYYYNWPYVDKNKAKMCPSPWRVPARSDIEDIDIELDPFNPLFPFDWFDGGETTSDNKIKYVKTFSFFWTTSVSKREPTCAWVLDMDPYLYLNEHSLSYGFQVRCVK